MINNGIGFSNMARINRNSISDSGRKSSNESASSKQIYFLKQNDIKFEEGISKKDAGKLIEEFKKK